MPQLKLQQNAPGPQTVWLQGTAPVLPQRSSEQTVPAGTQMPPPFSQQMLPTSHRSAAHPEVYPIGWQTPPQSAPPAAGSHSSFGSSTHP